MDEQLRAIIERARELYKPILTGPGSRITRGHVLFQQFEDAARIAESDETQGERQLFERVNELAVAKIMADDGGLKGSITYEPALLPSGRKIDFVADRGKDNSYVEVKSIRPSTVDNEKSWAQYEKRRKLHPEQANFITQKEWMGGKLYGDTFSSRAKFLEYALDFEDRLTEAKKVRPGPGLLVMCGNGMSYHRSNLEDFADFYHAGKHRQDDPFANMEAHSIAEKGVELRRNIDNFGYLRRHWNIAEHSEFVWPVRGPSFGGVIS